MMSKTLDCINWTQVFPFLDNVVRAQKKEGPEGHGASAADAPHSGPVQKLPKGLW